MTLKTIESNAQYEGLADKIDLIRDYFQRSLSYSSVRSFAVQNSMDNTLGKASIQVLFANLKSHVRYVPDPVGMEYIKAPWVMVQEINSQGWTEGDCDDFTSLSYALLRTLGIPAEMAVAWYDEQPNPTHIFVLVPTKDGARLPFDLVAPRLGVSKTGITGVQVYG